MNAGIRSRVRRDWPPGLEEPKEGYFVWKPPAKCRPYIEQQIGHRNAEMTAIYRDVRGSEWVKVS